MRTLFAISILALIALLWAGLSIAQHVRRARRKRRRELTESRATLTPTVELSFTELTPYSEAVVSRVELAKPEPVGAAVAMSAGEERTIDARVTSGHSGEGEPEGTFAGDPEIDERAPALPISVATEDTQTVPEPWLPALEQEEPFLPAMAPMQTPAQAIEARLPVEEPLPTPAEITSPEEPTATSIQATAPEPETPASPPPVPPRSSLPGFPKPARPLSPKHPLSRLVKKMERPDWAYFNKDMGDLTDPYESRTKPKDRAGN